MKLYFILPFFIFNSTVCNAQEQPSYNEQPLPHLFKSWLGKWNIEQPRFTTYDSTIKLREAQVWYDAENDCIVFNLSVHSYNADNDFNLDMKSYISFDSTRNICLIRWIKHAQHSSEPILFLTDGSFSYEYQQPFGKRSRITQKAVGDKWYTQRETLQIDKKWKLEAVSFMNKIN